MRLAIVFEQAIAICCAPCTIRLSTWTKGVGDRTGWQLQPHLAPLQRLCSPIEQAIVLDTVALPLFSESCEQELGFKAHE